MNRGKVISDSPEKTVYQCPECFGDGYDCDDSSKPCFECGGEGTVVEYKEEE